MSEHEESMRFTTVDPRTGVRVEVSIPPDAEEKLLSMARRLAGVMLLEAVEAQRLQGADGPTALRYGAYLALSGIYGRDAVRERLGISERTERRMWSMVRAAVAALPDGQTPETDEIAVWSDEHYRDPEAR